MSRYRLDLETQYSADSHNYAYLHIRLNSPLEAKKTAAVLEHFAAIEELLAPHITDRILKVASKSANVPVLAHIEPS